MAQQQQAAGGLRRRRQVQCSTGSLGRDAGCCAALDLQSACQQLLLYASHVDSMLSYGSKLWAPHLIACAAQQVLAVVSGDGGTSSTPSEPEQLHLDFLRALLGLPGGVLAEAGEQRLYVRWLGSAGWGALLELPAAAASRQPGAPRTRYQRAAGG